jgi:hypothetical protein
MLGLDKALKLPGEIAKQTARGVEEGIERLTEPRKD